MRLIYGSTNREKLFEVRRLGVQHGIDIIDLNQAASETGRGLPPEVHEPEVSYERNAVLKAKGFSQWLGRACMADDSGLEIDELGGLPGVYTARFGLNRVLQSVMIGRTYPARFVCAVAYADPSGRTVSLTASLFGAVAFPAEACQIVSSLPYSHFFIPTGRKEDLASILHSEESFRSHRGRAFCSLVESLSFPEAYRE